MASAKKCDICGKYYERYHESNNKEKVNGFMFLNIDTYQKYYSHTATDCCPECMTAVKVFIDTLKESYKMEE